MSKVTIEHISQYTGLSRGTVSRALNDRPDISEATKRRVLEACQKLNYAPSHAARSLATGRSYALGVFVDELDSPFTAAFVRGALDCAHASRYAVQITELGPSLDAAAERLRAVSVDRIDGLLIAAALDGALLSAARELFGARPTATTAPVAGEACDVFTLDRVEVGRLVARHLCERGARRIVLIRVRDDPCGVEIASGFEEACREEDAAFEHATVERVPHDLHDASALDALARACADGPAVACTSDDLAVFAALALHQRGRMPGRDVLLIGQGNSACAARLGLSSVDLGGVEIGRRSAEAVLQRVAQSRLDSPTFTRTAPTLVARATTRGSGE